MSCARHRCTTCARRRACRSTGLVRKNSCCCFKILSCCCLVRSARKRLRAVFPFTASTHSTHQPPAYTHLQCQMLLVVLLHCCSNVPPMLPVLLISAGRLELLDRFPVEASRLLKLDSHWEPCALQAACEAGCDFSRAGFQLGPLLSGYVGSAACPVGLKAFRSLEGAEESLLLLL